MDFIGSKGIVKKSEFVRIITDALISLGFVGTAARLEEESGIPLHSPIAKQFLKLVEDGEWDNCIDALHGFQLRDEKAVRFLLREQKFFAFLKIGNVTDALRTLREEMVPLDVNRKRIHELTSKLISASGEDTESVNSRSKVVEKLQILFPPAVIIPKRRLEYLVEKTLNLQRFYCTFHNIPDSDLSLCADHDCGDHKIPSETVQVIRLCTDPLMLLLIS